MQQLASLEAYSEHGAFHAGAAAYRLVSRYGFDREPELRSFLQLLAAAIAEDRKNAVAGAWSVGANNSWRFDYPAGTHVVTYQGEPMDLLEVVVQASGAPEFQRRIDGSFDVMLPRHFESTTTRFRIRSRTWATGKPGNDRWVGISETDDAPRKLPTQIPPRDLFPSTYFDGDDTFQRGRGPLEPGIVEKFSLSLRDVTSSLGHHYKIDGNSLVDVIVSLEKHPTETMRYVRVVRTALPPGADIDKARAVAVAGYVERCVRNGSAPSGWANEMPPNWWRGMSFDQLTLVAGDPGAAGGQAEKELLRRGYFPDGLGNWLESHPELTIRVPSAPINQGTPAVKGLRERATALVAVPRALEVFLRRAHEKRRVLRHGGRTWLIESFSIGSPPDVMKLVEAPPGDEPVLDFDSARTWDFAKLDHLEAGRLPCPVCRVAVRKTDAVLTTAVTGEPGAIVTCANCGHQWLALLDRRLER